MAKEGTGKRRDKADSESGDAPPKMKRKDFEKELYKLQVELTRLQAWAVAKRERVIRSAKK